MGWLIDPEEEAVLIYWAAQAIAIADEPEQLLPMPALRGEMNYRVADLCYLRKQFCKVTGVTPRSFRG